MRILLVEDDASIVEVVTAILDAQNYIVDIASDGESGWELAEAFPYDLVLLDIILPKLDGITFCRRLRERKNQALVMLLTARDTMTDKLIGLEAGADDYVVKPFNIQEVSARIRALLRRGHPIAETVLTCGDLHLDPGACEVTYKGQLLRFSRKEYLLLELFLRHQNRVFSRSAIVDQIWSFNEDPPNEDTVKSHIKSIRRKLDAVGAADLIETLYGQGYRISPTYLAHTRQDPQDQIQPQFQEQPQEKALPQEKAPQEKTPAPVAQKQEVLNVSVLEIWQRTKGLSLERINSLEQVVRILKAGVLDANLQQQAAQNAHKLAGSLGTFGFETGSQIARKVETLLQSVPSTLAAQKRMATQIGALVKALKAELVEPPELSAEAERAEKPEVSLWSEQSPLDSPEPTQQDPLLVAILSQDQALIKSLAAHGEQNLRIVEVTTVAVAQERFQQERPQVILIDSRWQTEQAKAGQEPPQLTELLAGLREPVPVAWLSNQTIATARLEAMQAGASLFLDTAMPMQEMLQAIVNLAHLTRSIQPRVLLVDDDPIVTKLLTACLKPQGIEVTGLEDPVQFWDILPQVNPNLLILDVNMPQINGIELCRTVRCDPQWRSLPIIFLTTQADPQTERQIFLSGADDLIFKPAKPSELSIRILNRLHRALPHHGFSRLIYPPPEE
jgi:DNA-binding response OmpR family regulator